MTDDTVFCIINSWQKLYFLKFENNRMIHCIIFVHRKMYLGWTCFELIQIKTFYFYLESFETEFIEVFAHTWIEKLTSAFPILFQSFVLVKISLFFFKQCLMPYWKWHSHDDDDNRLFLERKEGLIRERSLLYNLYHQPHKQLA